ncbi:MAG: DUF1294 domain-containing protein [Ruminococcaceae bacterium]|nr:DUF1294 domain-containing protein [Oscillospiraceae bacterium]
MLYTFIERSDNVQHLYIWIILISVIAVLLTVKDKYAARRKMRRVPERILLTVAALGGSVAMFLTMQIVRHKTKKAKFMLGIPLIFVLQVAALCLV